MTFDPSQYKLSRTGNTGAYVTGPDGVEYWYMPTDSLMGGSKIGDSWYYPTLQSGALDYIKGLSQYTVPDEWGAGLSGREISNLNTGFFLPYSDYSTNVSPYVTILSANPFTTTFSNGLGDQTISQGFGNANAYLGADGKYHWNEGGASFDVDPQSRSWNGNKTVTTTSGGGGLFGGFLGDIFESVGEALMDLGPILPIAAAATGNPILLGLNAGTQAAQGNILGAAAPFVPGLVSDLGASAGAFDAGAAMDAGIAQGAANAGTGALGSVAQTFPIDMSGPQLIGNTAPSAGGNMSWLDDIIGDSWNPWSNMNDLPSIIPDAAGAASGGMTASDMMGVMGDFIVDDKIQVLTNMGIPEAIATQVGPSLSGEALQGLINASGMLSGASGIQKLFSGTQAAQSGGLAGLLGTAGNLAGGYLNTQASKEAAQIQANAQIEAAKIAAEAAKFKPVGVTTRFGSSNFGYDANGNLTSAGYTLTPEMKAQQDQLMATSGGLLNQFQGAQAATAPMGTAAQRAMTLGNQYLATDPAAQAQKYMAEQQALLAPTRERQMASTLQGEYNRGTYGLGTGSTSTGMMAANPRLEALMNAQRQQDLGLAAQATQGGMDYAKFGAGMVGTGGDLLKSMYGTQTAAYSPYQTALGGATTIEGLGQNALTQGISLGGNVTAANAAAGGLLATGMQNAANTVGSNAQQAGSTWGNLLQGAGNWMNSQAQPTTGQNQGMMMYNPYTGQPIDWSK